MSSKTSVIHIPGRRIVWIKKRYDSIPESFKSVLRESLYFGTDLFDEVQGKRTTLTPPARLRCQVGPFLNADYYWSTAEEFLGYFKELSSLKPTEEVLDIGCGCGQMAAKLSEYLDQNSTYEGLDIAEPAIDWCSKNISSRYPNFHFQLADVFNKKYNPRGKNQPSQYTFPYEDESFDFVFAKSIFEHMLPEDIQHYLSEIVRVLKTGGRSLITFFLLNRESLDLMKTAKSTTNFKYNRGIYSTVDERTPEVLLAYDEAFILNLYKRLQLRITLPINFGWWCGRSSYLSYHDIIVASK